MKYPAVTFQFDKRLDIEIGNLFLNEKIESYDFGYDRIIKLHPDFLAWREYGAKKRHLFITQYVNTYYANNRKEMCRSLHAMQETWDKINERYFKHIERIFGSTAFYRPKRIHAKLSIFRCGVIEDNLKSFQIWYKTVDEPSEVRRHVAHEILHFLYYTYVKEKGFEILSQDWDMAEIFNRIVLNQPQFLNLTKKRDMGYSLHSRRIPKYQKLWRNSKGIDSFFQNLTER